MINETIFPKRLSVKMIIAFLLSLSCAQAVQLEHRLAKIYPFGTPPTGEAPYVQKIRIETEGKTRRAISTIEDRDKNVIMTETAVYQENQLVAQDIGQLQIGERYELRIKDGKTLFRIFKLTAGKEKLVEEKSEKLATPIVTGPGTDQYLNSQMTALKAGKKVKAQFAIFELARTVEFQFERVDRGEKSPNFKARMTPASFWLSMLVSAIELELDPTTFQIKRFRGRTPLRLKNGKKWDPMDAEIHYESADGSK
jgi:hypothetical protein